MANVISKVKKAWVTSEAAELAELYGDNFEQTEMDEITPPNNPRKRNRLEYLDIVERAMGDGVKMDFYNIVPGEERAAYTFTCHMPSGGKMVGNSIIELKDGKIIKETTVQAREK